jgi:hypothetical protein
VAFGMKITTKWNNLRFVILNEKGRTQVLCLLDEIITHKRKVCDF